MNRKEKVILIRAFTQTPAFTLGLRSKTPLHILLLSSSCFSRSAILNRGSCPP